MASILINFLVMAIGFYGNPFWYNNLLNDLNLVFSAIFALEAVLKLLAYGPFGYFRDNWNCFDISIVVGSWIGLITSFLGAATQLGGSVGVIRLLRAVRILRLIKQAKGLNQLVDTMIGSIPAFLNIGLLFFLVIFIYSIVGVDLFAKIAFG